MKNVSNVYPKNSINVVMLWKYFKDMKVSMNQWNLIFEDHLKMVSYCKTHIHTILPWMWLLILRNTAQTIHSPYSLCSSFKIMIFIILTAIQKRKLMWESQICKWCPKLGNTWPLRYSWTATTIIPHYWVPSTKESFYPATPEWGPNILPCAMCISGLWIFVM